MSSSDMENQRIQQENPGRSSHHGRHRKHSNRARSDSQNDADLYNPKIDGMVMLYHVICRLHKEHGGKPMLWNDVRTTYRKEFDRALNSDELNLICGTVNQTKHDLMRTNLRCILEPVDDKFLVIKLNLNKDGNPIGTPSPRKDVEEEISPGPISTASALQWQDNVESMERRLTFEKRKRELAEYLLLQGLVQSEVHEEMTVAGDGDLNKADPEEVFVDLIDSKQNDLESETTQEVFEQVTFLSPSQEVTGDFEDPTQLNSTDVVKRFERSLLEHKNSIGSLDEETIEASHAGMLSLENQCVEEDVEAPVDKTMAAEVSAVSSQMNAAFLASETQQISFESPLPAETSGEQGYSTAKEQVTSPEIGNKSGSIDPDNSFGGNIELCSSRIEEDSGNNMPQPDVSPVTVEEGGSEEETSVRFCASRDIRDGTTLEERVPHLHYVPKSIHSSRTDSEKLAHDASESEAGSRILPQPDQDTKDALPKAHLNNQDVQTDDDFLYDDDSQTEDYDVEKPAKVKSAANSPAMIVEQNDVEVDLKELSQEPATQSPVEVAETSPEIVSEVVKSEVVVDGVVEDGPVQKKKTRRVRITRRRWLDCCTIL